MIPGSDPYAAGACAAAHINTGSNPKACKDWLSPAAFVASGVKGTYGGTGKGQFRLPGTVTWDVNTTKNFALTERFNLQFRAEFFNVLNHTNFMDDNTSPQPSLTNFQKLSATSAFGALQQAGDPRIGQLALKLNF